jgi:hypothetical protein
MNSVELYEGLLFELPKQPPKEQILNYGLPKKEQKWKRIEMPKNWDDLSDEERQTFAFEEDRKCTEGIWLFINGVATYITGDHYHYLTWFKIDSGYPDYRDRDRRWYYHFYLCDTDPDCIGQCYGKLRRDGYSFRVDAIILNRARKNFDSHYGIVSKTGDDAKEMFQKLVHGFLSYPEFFKPQVQSAEDVKKSLVFKTPQQRVTHKNRKVVKELSLNTTIDFKNTKENAYDGFKLKILGADETGKWEEANVEKWYNIAKTCVTLGRRIIGKICFGSTVNESTKGGSNFKAIWDKSSILNKTENGRTGSGLWRYFVPAYDGIEGFIDEFGMSVIETPEKSVMGIDGVLITVGAKEYYENERKAKLESGDVVGYFEELRQRPFTEDEMFRDPANEETQFSLEKIYQQRDHNSIMVKDGLIRGNFTYLNGDRETKTVVWNPDSDGRWLIAWLPPAEERNRFTIKYGERAPANTHEGLFSVDPFDHKYTASRKQSKAASHGFHKTSFTTPQASNAFISQYWYRPNDPYILYEDMLMQCIFYGWEILGESNKPGCINYFRNRGYENYLMDRPAFTHTEYSAKNQKEKWLPNSGTVDSGIRKLLVEHLQSYIYQNIGINPVTEMMGNCRFDDTLNDWAKFDVEKWTDYDLTVSSMIAVVGAQNYVPQKANIPQAIQMFKKYNNSGMVSTEVKRK